MSNANLPANIADMVTGLAQSAANVRAEVGGSDGELYMKMSKFGVFSYGPEDIQVEEGSEWAVNPAGFQHGWICWGSAKYGTAKQMLGDHLGPASQPIFPEDKLEDMSGKGDWSKQVAIQLKCVSGEDAGIQALYKANSHGGKRAYTDLLTAVVEHIQAGDPAIVPIITLEARSYDHAQHGEIKVPVFKVVEWVAMDELTDMGAADETPEQEEEAEKEEAPKRQRRARSAETPKLEPEKEEEEEEEKEEAPQRRRRRRTN